MDQDDFTRGDGTRQRILDGAARLFARRSFTAVSVDEVVADSKVSRATLYQQFGSKELLARGVIEHHAASVRADTMELLMRPGSGLETLIEITFMVATGDACDDYARAAASLAAELSRRGDPSPGPIDEWIKGSVTVLEQAIADGDVRADCDPEDLAQVLVSHYVGVRQVSDLDAATSFLTSVKNSWCMTLPGFTNPQRLGYMTQFTTRRAAAAIRSVAHCCGD